VAVTGLPDILGRAERSLLVSRTQMLLMAQLKSWPATRSR
jgi:hypothetical protein